jgi:hypothetical protein
MHTEVPVFLQGQEQPVIKWPVNSTVPQIPTCSEPSVNKGAASKLSQKQLLACELTDPASQHLKESELHSLHIIA